MSEQEPAPKLKRKQIPESFWSCVISILIGLAVLACFAALVFESVKHGRCHDACARAGYTETKTTWGGISSFFLAWRKLEKSFDRGAGIPYT